MCPHSAHRRRWEPPILLYETLHTTSSPLGFEAVLNSSLHLFSFLLSAFVYLGTPPRCSGAQSQGQEQLEAPANEQQAGRLASSQVPAHIPSHRASSPASYAKQFGGEDPSWPLD